jgi:hypothetical protein
MGAHVRLCGDTGMGREREKVNQRYAVKESGIEGCRQSPSRGARHGAKWRRPGQPPPSNHGRNGGLVLSIQSVQPQTVRLWPLWGSTVQQGR